MSAMSGQAKNAAWYGWFDVSLASNWFGGGLSTPAAASVSMHACFPASSQRAWSGP